MAKKPKSPIAERLAALHAVGLFEELSLDEDSDDALAAAVDEHVSEHAYPYAYRAIQEVPAELGLDKVLRMIGLSTVAFESKDGTIAFTPKTHHQWAAMLDRALEEIGDPRRFIALQVTDWEEPLFVLATPAQAKVLREIELEETYVEDAEPETVSPDAALQDIVDILSRKLPPAITARVVGEAIELVTKSTEVGALVDALYNAHFADLRLSSHMRRRYGDKVKS